MKTALITGGAGFIGCYVIKALTMLGWKSIILDNFEYSMFHDLTAYDVLSAEEPRSNNALCLYVKGYIRNEQLLKRLFQEYKFDIVFHLAAIADTTLASDAIGLCSSVNIDGLKSIFSAMNSFSAFPDTKHKSWLCFRFM